jgi:quercetin dioxygenase-like cupin family protein
MRTPKVVIAALVLGLLSVAHAQTADPRKEISRVDLSGAPGMEVVSSVSEYKKGDTLPRHFHHGVEAAYVIQGTRVQAPGKDPMELLTGAPVLNLRDIGHGGYTVVGDQSLKLFTVHIVDKGKPLYDTNVK